MPSTQRSPQLRHERSAESQVDWVDGSTSVEFGRAFNFHFVLVVKHICCINNYTTNLMYVNNVVEMRGEWVPHGATRRSPSGVSLLPV